LRIQLACEFEGSFDRALPSREDIGRLRAVIDVCADHLEGLGWGQASGEVQMVAPQSVLEAIAEDLREGGNERLMNPMGWNSRDARKARTEARNMIAAADALSGAPGGHRYFQTAS
jgi:hypothetical protein